MPKVQQFKAAVEVTDQEIREHVVRLNRQGFAFVNQYYMSAEIRDYVRRSAINHKRVAAASKG